MKCVSLLSGGIDSAVANHLMLKKGVQLTSVYMDNRPFTCDNTLEKAKGLAQRMADIYQIEQELYVVPHGKGYQVAVAKQCDAHVRCVLCRRAMLMTAERIARRIQATAIVTGESLGQVASQTLPNIAVEEQAIGMPVLRPLIGFDKEEIVNIAKEIGTYDISITPGGCCTFVPEKPATKSDLARVLAEEEKLDINGLVEKGVDSAEILNFKPKA